MWRSSCSFLLTHHSMFLGGFCLRSLAGTNYVEENPLVRRGVLPGSSADNSQILSTAIGVENKAIVFCGGFVLFGFSLGFD